MNGLSGFRRRAPESFSYDIPREDADNDFRIDESLEDERQVGTSSHNALQHITTPGGDFMEVFAPVDNISSNKDQTMFVAAGSFGVIKIFRMADRFHMHQVADLRALKQKKLAYTASAVVWSKVAENLIATVSTNGTVVLWDPTVPAVLQETRGHSRSATSVDFHRSNPFLLVSSSKDALMMHDTRTIEVPRRYKINNDTIRDVSFCLHQPHHDYFVAADETGAVKFWDMRKEDKPFITFQPHHGLASSVALHPTNPSLIASGGGRDKLIKVWDWRLPKNWERKNFKTIYQVETIAPISRVYWRPDKEHEIASCAVVSDTSVAVWDVRRPFLPVTSYRGHRDSATDIWWNHNDPSYFVSAGKDGFIRLHRIEEGEHTVDHLCDCTMDIAPDGMMAVAVSTQIGMKQMAKQRPERKKGANLQFTQRPGVHNLRSNPEHQLGSPGGRRMRTVHFEYDPFKDLVPSCIATGIPSSALRTAQPRDFARLASDYIVGGKSCQELCEWNARVAGGYGFPDKAESWRVLGALIESACLEQAYKEENDKEEERKNIMREKYRDMLTTDEMVLMLRNAPVPQPKNSEHTLLNINKHLEWNPIIFSSLPFEQSTVEESICPPEYVENSDFYFGPGELRGTAFGLRNEEPPCDDFLGLESEAFTLRPCSTSSKYTDLVNSSSNPFEFNPLKKIKLILMRYAEQGDVQMCTVAAAIIGHHLSKELSSLKIEMWARSYFDMLERLELHVACAQVVKFAWMRGIKERGHQSTFLPVHYQHLHPVKEGDTSNTIVVGNKRRKHCKGHIDKGRCSKCRDPVLPICVACDRPIIGLLWSCVKCSHSMHVQHALHHFKNQSEPESDDESTEDKLLSKARQMAKVSKKCPVAWCRCNCNVRIRAIDDAVIPSKMASIPLVSEAIQKMKGSERVEFLLNAKGSGDDDNGRVVKVSAGQEIFLDLSTLTLSCEDNELLESLENRCQVAEEMDDPFKQQIRSITNLVYALYATNQSKVEGYAEYLRSIRESAIEAKCSIYQEIVDITDPRYSAMDRIADYNETCVIDEEAEVGKYSDDDRSSMASECDPEAGISLSPSGREEDIRDSITSVTITSGGPSSSNTELLDEEPILSDLAYMPRRAVASEEIINDPAFKFMYGEEYQVAMNAILRPTKPIETPTSLELKEREVVIRALEGPPEEEEEQLECFNRFYKRMMDKQSRATSIRIERLLNPELAARPLQRPIPPQRIPFGHESPDSEERGRTEDRRSPTLRNGGPMPFYPVTSALDTVCETRVVNDCGRVRIYLPAIPTKESKKMEQSWWSWGSTEEDPIIAKNLETVVKEVNREMFDMEMEITHHDLISTKLPIGISARTNFLTEVETVEQSIARRQFFENLETSVESDPITVLLHEGHGQARNTPDRNMPRYY